MTFSPELENHAVFLLSVVQFVVLVEMDVPISSEHLLLSCCGPPSPAMHPVRYKVFGAVYPRRSPECSRLLGRLLVCRLCIAKDAAKVFPYRNCVVLLRTGPQPMFRASSWPILTEKYCGYIFCYPRLQVTVLEEGSSWVRTGSQGRGGNCS